MADNNKQPSEASELSRRKFLVATGGSSIVLTAGCSSGGKAGDGNGETTDDGGGTSGATPIDPAYTNEIEGGSPDQQQFNLYSVAPSPSKSYGFWFDRLANWNATLKKFQGELATDWNVSDDKMTIEIYDGQTWESGDPITADDVVTRLKLDIFQGDAMGKFIDSVSASSDTTVELQLTKTGINPGIIKRQVFNLRWMFTPTSVFGEDVAALEEASSEDEQKSIITEIAERKFPDTSEVGSGMFSYDGHDSQKMYGVLREDYENQYITADDLSFTEFEAHHKGSRQEGLNAWQQKIFDGAAMDMSDSFYQANVKDWTHRQTRFDVFKEGQGLQFNWDDPVYGTREVRQAICYILDRDALATNAPYHETSTQVSDPYWNVGLIQPVRDIYLDPQGFIDYYGDENRMEKAAELMRKAGFTKKNGTWTGKIGGKTLEATVKIPPWWQQQGRTAVSQLNEFGIPVDSIVQEGSTYESDLSNNNWRIASGDWGGGMTPWTNYSNPEQSFSAVNAPNEIEVPEVGTSLDNDSTITVNISEELDKLLTADEAQTKEITRKLAWVWNVTVPFAQYWDFAVSYAYSHDEWDAPSIEEEPRMDGKRVLWWQFKRGLADAKTK